MKILTIVGSIRSGSFNKRLAQATAKIAPERFTFEMASIDEIPLYNDDVFQNGFPDAVARLREQISEADAVLLVTPEYNFSIPGVLKNAIDWVSRPPDQPFDEKPVAIMGASRGKLGTARVQYHLRQVLVALNARVVNRPEVFIGSVHTQLDDENNFTDDTTAKFVNKLLLSLEALGHPVLA